MDLSVIVTDREEPYLIRTVECIRESCHGTPPEIIIVQDGGKRNRKLPAWTLPGDFRYRPWDEARGCMAARDFGIMKATRGNVCVVDAHMDFEKGLFEDMVARCDAMGGRGLVGCGCSALLPKKWIRSTDPAHKPKYAAYPIAWAEGKPFQFKWNYASRPVEAAFAMMGACYMMRKSWYEEELLRPWQFGTAWGGDEETITAANYLAEGGVSISPLRAWHWFRSQHELPFKTGAKGIYGQFANAMRIWDMFPASQATYDRAMAMLAAIPMVKARAPQIQALRDEQEAEVDAYAAAFEARHPNRTLDDFLARCISLEQYLAIDSSDPEAPSKPGMPPFPAMKETKGAEDAILQWTPGTVVCIKCKVAKKRTHAYPNGNTLHSCPQCGRKTITRPVKA